MKKRHLLPCLLLVLSGCNNAPENGARKARGERPVLVETVVANSVEAARTIERNGSLRAEREVKLSLQQEGALLELPFHEGDHVSQGSLLARLDDTLLRAQLKKSQAQRHQAAQDLKRLQRLQSSRVISEDELARAKTALDVARAEEEELSIRLEQARILAPFDGTISERLAEPGDAVARFSHVLTLIDTQRLSTELKVSELVLDGLQLGDEVSMTIDALGPQHYSGTLHRIHPKVDEASRQGTIEVLLNQPPQGARPGQLCRVEMTLRKNNRLLVPYNALRRDTRGEYLFVVNSEKRVERRAVISGLHFDEMVELLDGVNSGERIVTRGFLGLSEGGLVSEAPAGPAQ